MARTKTQNKVETVKVNGEEYSQERIAEITGLSVETVKHTPRAALESLVQTHLKAKRASGNREKKSALQKFKDKANGSLADATRRAIREQFLVGVSEMKKEDRNDTQKHMDTYTPKIISVLYEMDLLDPAFKDQIEDILKDD